MIPNGQQASVHHLMSPSPGPPSWRRTGPQLKNGRERAGQFLAELVRTHTQQRERGRRRSTKREERERGERAAVLCGQRQQLRPEDCSVAAGSKIRRILCYKVEVTIIHRHGPHNAYKVLIEVTSCAITTLHCQLCGMDGHNEWITDLYGCCDAQSFQTGMQHYS